MSECILTFNANKSLKKNHQNQRHYTFNNVIQTGKSIILANKVIRPDWYYLELKWRASSVKILHFLGTWTGLYNILWYFSFLFGKFKLLIVCHLRSLIQSGLGSKHTGMLLSVLSIRGYVDTLVSVHVLIDGSFWNFSTIWFFAQSKGLLGIKQ